MKAYALTHLRKALDNEQATFRDGQWESIEHLLNRQRVLVVQRTGWGKSMVYFLATKLLRDQGAGPTLLISPLLSLMRNQIQAAERIGVRAHTINSTNIERWAEVEEGLNANTIDVLLISPERLANEAFRQNIFSFIAGNIGLFVVDEAHCISDWGHDFRPDYRRIVRILRSIPSNVPILATTATANDRVVSDIKSQLGEHIELQRGSLVRRSLKLQNIVLPSPAARLAWLVGVLPKIPGSGIIYTLTKRDAEQVAEWLQFNEIKAVAYHSGVEGGRAELEQQLLDNKIKALVATVALGMGFDKPDLGFVIHFQRPASVVHYYQQVGRAGRAVDEAFGILLGGEEDDHIAEYFIRTAFPPQQHVNEIIAALDQAPEGLSLRSMESILNLRHSQIEKALKYLTIESPAPVVKIKSRWQATAAANSYTVDQVVIDAITQIRRREQEQMRAYMSHSGCLMAFLQDALDDKTAQNCGMCRNCRPDLLLSEEIDDRLLNQAAVYLRRSYQPLTPRKQWPVKDMFVLNSLCGFKIPDNQLAQEGRALSVWRDAGWGQLVARGKSEDKHFADELVAACAEMIQKWQPDPFPQWVTAIPSHVHPSLVPDFAQRVAAALNLPFVPCVIKERNNRPQREMNNSAQQVKNLDGAFKVTNQCLTTPCLLIDDVVASGWTLTVAAALLGEAGCAAVVPLALALNSSGVE